MLAGAHAVVPPEAPPPGSLLILCGSHVPATTRQLAVLERVRPGALVEADLAGLAAAEGGESERLAAAASRLLEADGLAVVATPRRLHDRLAGASAGLRIARGLARVAALVDPAPAVVVAKGGITAAVVLEHGLGATEATVAGPLLPGVSLWRAHTRGGARPLIVFPGNVGGDGALRELVSLLAPSPATVRGGA